MNTRTLAAISTVGLALAVVAGGASAGTERYTPQTNTPASGPPTYTPKLTRPEAPTTYQPKVERPQAPQTYTPSGPTFTIRR